MEDHNALFRCIENISLLLELQYTFFFFLFPQPVWSEWPSQWDPVWYVNFNFFLFIFFSICCDKQEEWNVAAL